MLKRTWYARWEPPWHPERPSEKLSRTGQQPGLS